MSVVVGAPDAVLLGGAFGGAFLGHFLLDQSVTLSCLLLPLPPLL